MQEKNYDFVQGDSFVINFTVTDGIPTTEYPDGTPIDITDGIIVAEFKDRPGGNILAARCDLDDGITIIDAESGQFKLTVVPEKTKKFIYPKTVYQVQYTDVNNKVDTLLKGWIDVDPGVIN